MKSWCRSIQTGAGQVEYTPIGHTTNLASRMQTVAPVGSIAVSENTRRLCEGYFILKPLGATRVRGVSDAVNVYEVTGLGPLRTRLQRAVGRGLTKFVGREREMEALKHAAELARTGYGQIVAAMAEPGVGKSRLYFEFKATLEIGLDGVGGFLGLPWQGISLSAGARTPVRIFRDSAATMMIASGVSVCSAKSSALTALLKIPCRTCIRCKA